jgi:hypothetical protein
MDPSWNPDDPLDQDQDPGWAGGPPQATLDQDPGWAAGPPQVAQAPPYQEDPRWVPGAAPYAPVSGPPGQFGQHAPAPYDFGRASGADSASASGMEFLPLMQPDSAGSPGGPADAGPPAGRYDPYQAGFPGPADPQGAAPGAPEWLQRTGELPAITGPGYQNAAQQPVPVPLDSFPPRGKPRKRRLLAAATVVAVILLAGIAIFATRHPGSKAGHAPHPAPAGSRAAAAQASQSARSGRGVSGAAVSPGAVSTALIFPHAQVVASGISFNRVISVLNWQCSRTARGAFAAALSTAGCQRVVRATFVDVGRQLAITAGVAQLPSPAAAQQADRNGKFGPDVWFTGLDGPAGSGAAAVSKTVGFGYDVVYGRYIIYALATYSSGWNPTGHPVQVRALETLSRSFTALVLRPLQPHPK